MDENKEVVSSSNSSSSCPTFTAAPSNLVSDSSPPCGHDTRLMDRPGHDTPRQDVGGLAEEDETMNGDSEPNGYQDGMDNEAAENEPQPSDQGTAYPNDNNTHNDAYYNYQSQLQYGYHHQYYCPQPFAAYPYIAAPPVPQGFNVWIHAWHLYMKRPLCRFYQSGNCKNDYRCEYRHFSSAMYDTGGGGGEYDHPVEGDDQQPSVEDEGDDGWGNNVRGNDGWGNGGGNDSWGNDHNGGWTNDEAPGDTDAQTGGNSWGEDDNSGAGDMSSLDIPAAGMWDATSASWGDPDPVNAPPEPEAQPTPDEHLEGQTPSVAYPPDENGLFSGSTTDWATAVEEEEAQRAVEAGLAENKQELSGWDLAGQASSWDAIESNWETPQESFSLPPIEGSRSIAPKPPQSRFSGCDDSGKTSTNAVGSGWGPQEASSSSLKEESGPATPIPQPIPLSGYVADDISSEDLRATLSKTAAKQNKEKGVDHTTNRAERGKNKKKCQKGASAAVETPKKDPPSKEKEKQIQPSPYPTDLSFDSTAWGPTYPDDGSVAPVVPSSFSPALPKTLRDGNSSLSQEPSHTTLSPFPSDRQQAVDKVKEWMEDKPCKFWSRGKSCTRTDCRFAHNLDNSPPTSDPRPTSVIRDSEVVCTPDPEPFCRQIDDSLEAEPLSVTFCGFSATFGPGLVVRKAKSLSKPLSSRLDSQIDVDPGSFDSLLLRLTKPGRAARLDFGTQTEAVAVRKILDGLDLRGHALDARFPHRQSGNPPFRLRVKQLPMDITERELRSYCPHAPQVIFLEVPEEFNVNRLLAIFPEKRYPSTEFHHKKESVVVKFHSSSARLRARKETFILDGNPISVEDRYSDNFLISEQHYSLLQNGLKAWRTRFKDSIAFFTVNPGERDTHRTLCLHGSDRDIFFSFRAWVEKRIDREPLPAIWNDILSKSYVVNEFEAATESLVVVDSLFKQVYPSPACNSDVDISQRAGQVLQELIDQEVKLAVNGAELGWLSGPGLARLRTDLNVEASIDLINSKLVLWKPTGGVECIIRYLRSHVGPLPLAGGCMLCRGQPVDPIRLKCGHLFCGPCIVRLVGASGCDGSRVFSCNQKSTPSCHEPADLALLLSERNETTLRSIFLQYVRQRPGQYQICPTLECRTVLPGPDALRKSNKATHFQCFSCRKRFCLSCRSRGHIGVTCEEFQTKLATIQLDS